MLRTHTHRHQLMFLLLLVYQKQVHLCVLVCQCLFGNNNRHALLKQYKMTVKVCSPQMVTHTHTHTHTRKKRRTGIDQGGGTFRTVGVTVSGLCVCVMCERKFKSQLHMRRHESHSNMHKRNIIIRQEYLDAQQKDNNDLYTHIHTHTHTSAVETA
eukprot:GHVR01006920.1.p1 GENE.GHVR01006920.1~~GHVR01006920.1.p1  ORF type:complete len:156 (+),score=73.93 GHVR01006920.1:320-787(+)